MRKIILAVVAIVIIAIGGGVFFLFSNLDSLVKTVIEQAGSRVAGVPVRLSSVKIALTDGKASLKGLTVGNPAGFKTPNAVSLGEIAVAIDTGSVTKNPIVIKEVTIAGAEVTYEIGGSGGSNVDAIQKNVQSFTAANGGGSKAGTAAPAAETKDEKDAKKLVIELLQLKDGKVTLATPLPGGKATGSLPDIKLTNIGKASGGATGAEVAGQLLDAISKSALKAVANIGIGGVVDSVSNAAGGALGGGKGGLDAVKGLLGK